MIKKYLFALGLLLLGSSTYAAQIIIEPQFADPRFEPANKLHAGCIHSANINIKTNKNEDISSFRFIISYEPQNIEILNIKPNDAYKSVLDSKIEYDKIIVSVLNKSIPQGETSNLFTISFKSNEFVSGSILAIRKPSYLIDKNNKEIPVFVEQDLVFEKVLECEPDIVQPSITLVKPQDTSKLLGLDGYFTFSIKDLGKGVDQNSLIIDFDNELYTGKNTSLIREKDQISFYPKKWLPIGKSLELTITVSDKQKYGGANTIKKTFNFQTRSGIVFENVITPTIYRNLISKMPKIYSNAEECMAFKLLIKNSDSIGIPIQTLKNLGEKINCIFDKNTIKQSTEKTKEKAKSVVFLSVFSVLGWVLFGITFILKLHYIASYKKHKKLAKSLQSSQPTQ